MQIPPRESWNGELIGYTVNCSEEKQNINYISVVNSSQKSTIVSGWATTKATLRGLRKYTRYAVTIRAMNGFGSGPWSAAIFGSTAEGGGYYSGDVVANEPNSQKVYPQTVFPNLFAVPEAAPRECKLHRPVIAEPEDFVAGAAAPVPRRHHTGL